MVDTISPSTSGDHYPPQLWPYHYCVALHTAILIEDARGDTARAYSRGLYLFTNKELAQKFVATCNGAVLEEVASLFENPHKRSQVNATQTGD